jgi:hypothetical protein
VATPLEAASALTDALVALRMAEQAINVALTAIGATSPKPDDNTRTKAAVRTTSTQVLAVLSSAGEPLSLIDVADGVVALRRGEDVPRKRGGTRYQEMCRTAIARLVARGLVERVPPTDRTSLMRFQRTATA